MEFSTRTTTENETLALGQQVASLLEGSDLIAFFGDLGSGKTCFIKGICKGLGTKDYVTSPTFTLINEYSNNVPVYHFDFYRITCEAEIYGLGYEEYFYGNGICLIEWADRIIDFLPAARIEIYLENLFEPDKETHRNIVVKIIGEKYVSRKWENIFKIYQLKGMHIEDPGD